jgi:hypothetical protein
VSDDRKTTPPASSGGGSPAGCTTEPCECCCCVTSLAIQNINRIDNASHMGHSFDTVIGLTYTGTGTKKSCTFEWWEKTNVPAITGHQANVWTDMFQLMGGASFGSWTGRREPCPGSETVTDTDPPALGRTPGRTVTRTLEFRVVVKSGAGCSCGNASMQVTAKQVLVMVNAAPDWASSSFTTP